MTVMQVEILGQRYTYQSDYTTTNREWKIQAGAAFIFPVKIGSRDCFIKRFTIPPPGYAFLKLLKAVSNSPLPVVYDIVENTEYGQKITYLFLEFIEGDTLEDVIFQRQPFHSRKLTNGVLDCFKIIHDNGYWFSDFCEKNIFFDKHSQRYTLIDIDSCEPLAHRPSPTPNTPGFVPGQEFASAVVSFFRHILHIPHFNFASLTGIQLNLLQLVPLVAKLKLFVQGVQAKPNFIYTISNFPKLHSYIHGKYPAYSKAVFEKVLQNQASSEYISTLCGRFPSAYGAVFEPQILSFKAKPSQVEIGEEVTFSWETANAEQIILKSADGRFIKSNLPNIGVISVKIAKGQRFRLVADTASEAVDIKLISSPQIKVFTSPRSEVYLGEKVALRWEIEGRPKQATLSERDQSGQIVWSKSVSPKGIIAVEPLRSSQTYVLNIGNIQKEIHIQASVKPVIFYLTTSCQEITQGQTAELSWAVHNASSVLLYEHKVGQHRKLLGVRKATVSSEVVSALETTTYILEAQGGIVREVTITVLLPQIVTFSLSTSKIKVGENLTITWDIKHTDKGRLLSIDSKGLESVLLNNLSEAGKFLVSPTDTTIYKLDVGVESQQVEVPVEKPFVFSIWLRKLWPFALILCLGLAIAIKLNSTKALGESAVIGYERLLDAAENAVRNENFDSALVLLDSARNLQRNNEIPDSDKALQLYNRWTDLGIRTQEALEKNKDYDLMDIPIQYLEMAQILKPSAELQAKIDECRADYQKAKPTN